MAVPEASPAALSLLWTATLDRLDPPTRALLANCQPRQLSDEVLELGVANDFTRQRIDQRLRLNLEQTLSDQAGQVIRVQLTLDPDLKPPIFSPDSPLSPVVEPSPVVAPAPRPSNHQSSKQLNERYTFDSFIPGPFTRFAHAAAVAVAEGAVEEGPGKAYNPLLIYGDSGLGKTHLLHAIGHYITDNSSLQVKYVSTEELTNDFINAIAQNRPAEFRRTYREVDVLLVDDIQFLQSKIGTQEEFFHTFNTLHNAQKQIVLTSDRPPRLLEALEPRLRSRFEGGLLVDVQPSELETRVAILQKKAETDELKIPLDVLHFIATRITRNIRELEGALIRLTAFSSLSHQPINLQLAEMVLRDLVAEDLDRPITIAMVLTATADFFQLTLDDLTGPGRSASLSLARQIAMYLSRELTDLSLPKIGAEFSRDHTTVMHGYRRIRDLILSDRTIFTTVTDITNRIKTSPYTE